MNAADKKIESVGFVYSTAHSSAAQVLNVSLSNATKDEKVPSDDEETDFVFWGADNKLPYDLYEKAKKSSIIRPGLNKLARLIYGGGIEVGVFKKNERSKKEEFVVLGRSEAEEFYNFKRTADLPSYLLGSALDIVWFKNVFPQISLNPNRDKIIAIKRQMACDCRWGWQNKNGVVEKCYISKKFKTGDVDKSEALEREVINSEYDPKEQLESLVKKSKKYHFIYPIKYPGVVENYYPLPEWATSIESGWLDLSSRIAEFKNNLMLNQISIVYHIEIDNAWWEMKFPEWENYDVKKKKEITDKVITEFLEAQKGTKQAGSIILTPMITEEDSQGNPQQTSLWKITVIDNKLKDGAFILDSQEASAHIFSAIGLDPTITGVLPGKGEMPSSGSDKRVAVNMEMTFQQVHRDLILEPLYLIRDFNGWPSTWEFRFKTPEITKLDSGKEFKEL